MNIKNKSLLFLILWALSLGIPWALVIFPGFKLFPGGITLWNSVWEILDEFLIPCLILSLLVTVFQYFLLKDRYKVSKQWVIPSVLSYSFAPPICLLIVVIILGLLFPTAMIDNGSTVLLFPLPLIMLLSGLLIGIAQIPSFSKIYSKQIRKKISLLWVTASSLSWGMSFWISLFMREAGFNLRLQSAFAGLTIGMITGVVFYIADFEMNKVGPNNKQYK